MASRRLFIASSAAVALAGCNNSNGLSTAPSAGLPSDGDFQYGALLNDAEFTAAPEALPVEATGAIRGTSSGPVILTNLPAIAQQGGATTALGSPGSCESQALAYGLGSYTAARNTNGTPRWNPTDPSNSVSAAWMYSWSLAGPSNRSCPKGTLATPYLTRMVSTGAPSRAQFPYVPDCSVLGPMFANNPNPSGQSQFQIGSYAVFRKNGLSLAQFVTLVQGYLNAGNAVGFSGLVTYGYSKPSSTPVNGNYLDSNGVWQATAGSGGHGQLIVGYNDTLQAFLVQNSFGTQWPFVQTQAPTGMLYWAYNSIYATQSYFVVAYPANTGTSLTGTVLTSSSGTAPTLAVQLRSYTGTDGTQNLVIMLDSASPIVVDIVTATSPGNQTFTKAYKNAIRTGYTFVSSSGGSPFASGPYQISLTAALPGATGSTFTYSGAVTL